MDQIQAKAFQTCIMTLLSQQGSLALVQPGCWTRMALCLARLDDGRAECLNLSKTTAKVPYTFPYRADIFFCGCWGMPPSGQKARLANKTLGFFSTRYPPDRLNFEQKSLEIQMRISPFSACRDLGSRLWIWEGNFHRWWNALLVKTRLFFRRWLAGNLASRCWVIGSHKSANPAFLPVHSCFTITMMSAEHECD